MAIAYDEKVERQGVTPGTSLSFSHTCGGSNRLLLVGVTIHNATAKTVAVTYGGVSMTKIGQACTDDGEYSYLFYLLDPASGANTVAVSWGGGSEYVYCASVSYTGVKQTGQPDANTTGVQNTTNFSLSVTTIADNCWTMALMTCWDKDIVAGAGTTLRAVNDNNATRTYSAIFDSNAAKTPAGTSTLTASLAGGHWAGIIASFAPYVLNPPDAPTNVAATDGDYTDKVRITWTKSAGATGYKVYEGANLIATLGDVDTYDDTGAGAPTITPGTADASDGLYTDKVVLTLSGHSTSNGASRTYGVKATNAAGDSSLSSTDTGYRGVGSITYQWQRSAADSDASYSDIGSATTNPYNDTGAPSDGSGRYFKCVLNATGASAATSTANRGYRAQNLTKSLAETLTLTDSIKKGPEKKTTDNPSLADSLSKTDQMKRTETLNLADALARQLGFFKTQAETLALADLIKKTTGKYRTENPAVADVLQKTIIKYLTDNPATADALLKTLGKYKTETINLSDLISKTNGKYLAELLNLSDIFRFDSAINLTESLAVTGDALSLTINSNISDSVQISDVIGLVTVYNRIISENLPLYDAITAVSEYFRTIGETVALADDISASLVLFKDLSELLSAQDLIRFEVGKYTADNLNLSDVIGLVSTYYRNLADQLNLSDETRAVIEKNILDNLNLSDRLTFTFEKILLGMVTLSDLFSAGVEKAVADGTDLSDSLVAEKVTVQSLSDSLVISEVLINDVGKGIAENISVNDYINTATNYNIGIQDSVAVVERLIKDYNLGLREAITLVDNLLREVMRPLPKETVIPKNRDRIVMTNSKRDRIILISKLK